MPRLSSYILLYLVVMSLQSFFFNNLTISISLTPLVYIAFLLFLPIRTSQISMLLLGLFLGISADMSMGLAGVNTIVTLFMAYIRIYIYSIFLAGEITSSEDSMLTLAAKRVSFIRQISIFFIFTLLHHTLFFLVETLSITPFPFWIGRTLLSTVVTTVFVSLLYNIFQHIFFNRNRKL